MDGARLGGRQLTLEVWQILRHLQIRQLASAGVEAAHAMQPTLSLAAGGCSIDGPGNPKGANCISHTLHGQCYCFFPRVILCFPGFISTWLIESGLHRTTVCQVLEGLGKLNCIQMADWPHRVSCCFQRGPYTHPYLSSSHCLLFPSSPEL